jgi:tetratricopeptide (TPR) repeat protein
LAARSSLILLLAAAACALGCAAGLSATGGAPRVSDLAAEGDDQLRASQRLVLEGLDADEQGDPERARSRYERALQIDASNPWVYLALARHYVELGEPGRALSHLDRAEALLDAQGGAPGARIHCDGLRGAALALEGDRAGARPLLDAAAHGAPGVWGDGELSASELR